MKVQDFEPEIIHQYVNYLYKQAKEYIFVFSFFGIAIGGFSVYFINSIFSGILMYIFSIAVFVLWFYAGNKLGNHLAFSFKFKAQSILLQMKIEENTRKNIKIENSNR